MSAPFIWIIFPALAGVLLLIAGQRFRYVELTGAGLAAVLAFAAARFPEAGVLTIRQVSYPLNTTMTILGRPLIIRSEMLGLVAAVYAAVFVWFLMAAVVRPGRYFVPLGFGVVALFMAAMTFGPWEFVGIFVLMSVLLFVVILAPPDEPVSQGALNFLSFNAMGVPFLLVAGALISGLAGTPPGLEVVERPAIFLGIGFAFLLALFPFHAWMPRLAEDARPLSTAFVFVFLPAFVCILLLQLIDRNVWLRNSQEVFTLIRSIGMVTILAGGIFAAFQRDMGRIMGFASLVQTGLFLLAIGAGPRVSATLFFPLLVGRSLGFLCMASGLDVLKSSYGSLRFRSLQGAARIIPVPAFSAVLGVLSLGGLPLLLGYVPLIRLYGSLTQIAPAAVLAAWIGVSGLLFSALRSLAVLVMLPEDGAADEPARRSDYSDRQETFALIGASITLIAAGLYPAWIEPVIRLLPLAFAHLRP